MPTNPVPTLFEIGADLHALLNLVEASDHDLDDPEAIEALETWFREIETNQGAKFDNYIGLIRVLEMEAAKEKEEAERFALAASVRANRVKRLKKRMLDYMDGVKLARVVTDKGRTVTTQNNGGVVPIVPEGWEGLIADMAKFAAEYPQYVKTTVTVDTTAVRKALDGGAKLPFAALGQRGRQLRIK